MVREEAEIRCAEIEPLHLTLIELEKGNCRFPYGDSPEPITFCGHLKCTPIVNGVAEESSYCAAHHVLCTKLPTHRTGIERPDIAALMRRRNRHSGMTSYDATSLAVCEEAAS
jgi:hypothetical protein